MGKGLGEVAEGFAVLEFVVLLDPVFDWMERTAPHRTLAV